jgi:competence protein ComEA
MWHYFKDYFSFSRKDLRGISVLLVLLMLMLLARLLLPGFYKTTEPDFSEFDRMVLLFEQAQRIAREAEKKPERKEPEFLRPDREIAGIKLNPFPFDPNTMKEEEWVKLGLNIRQIRNIQNYIASGARFSQKEDFRRVYTISDEEFEILEPFIRIIPEVEPEPMALKSDSILPGKKFSDIRTAETPKDDINLADSLLLIRVRGIGPVFAQRIIRYRELLGGFHSASQLFEVYGLDSTRIDAVTGRFYFESNTLKKIDVNSAEIQDLTAHPYIDYYLAKSIVDQRIKKGSLVSDADLYGIALMHDALYKKIIPYLFFKTTNDD